MRRLPIGNLRAVLLPFWDCYFFDGLILTKGKVGFEGDEIKKFGFFEILKVKKMNEIYLCKIV